jgi:hypothetical protein
MTLIKKLAFATSSFAVRAGFVLSKRVRDRLVAA